MGDSIFVGEREYRRCDGTTGWTKPDAWVRVYHRPDGTVFEDEVDPERVEFLDEIERLRDWPMPAVEVGPCFGDGKAHVYVGLGDGWVMNGRSPQARLLTEAEARALARELVRAADLLRAEDY